MGGESKEKLLRVTAAADRLNYTDRHVRRLLHDGKIQYIEEGPRRRFIPESAVEAFRKEQENS